MRTDLAKKPNARAINNEQSGHMCRVVEMFASASENGMVELVTAQTIRGFER
mgnify:CR=1 FL=1